MAYKITEERKEKLVNVIAEITAELKKFDEVECITWSASKDDTAFTNFLDFLQGQPSSSHNSKTGNLLSITVITPEGKTSSELGNAIYEMNMDFVNSKLYKQTGVDIEIHTSSKKYYKLYSDSDKAIISRLVSVLGQRKINHNETIRFINNEVYNGNDKASTYCIIHLIGGRRTKVKTDVRSIVSHTLHKKYPEWRFSGMLYYKHIVYDKTGYFNDVANQFKGYEGFYDYKPYPRPLYSKKLNIGIDDELELKLKSTN